MPGGVVIAATEAEPLYECAYGVRNAESREPMTLDTVTDAEYAAVYALA